MQKDINKFMIAEKRQQSTSNSTNKKRNGGKGGNNNFNLSSLTAGTPEKANIKGILNALNMSSQSV